MARVLSIAAMSNLPVAFNTHKLIWLILSKNAAGHWWFVIKI
jgi:hypothetical protein